MGSRSKSEIISQFSLEEICRNQPRNKSIGRAYGELDEIIKEAAEMNSQLTSKSIMLSLADVKSYFRLNHPNHYNKLMKPDIPPYLLNKYDDEWQVAVAGKNNKKRKVRKKSSFEQWINCDDLTEARRLKKFFTNPSKKSKEKEKKVSNSFSPLDIEDSPADISYEGQYTVEVEIRDWILAWREPTTERNLKELKVLDQNKCMSLFITLFNLLYFILQQNDSNVWRMSKKERVKLHDFWREEIHSETVGDLSGIRERYKNKKKEIEDIYNEG